MGHNPVAKEGYPFIGISFLLAVVCLVFFPFFSPLFAILTAFVVYFFRNPSRRPYLDSSAIVSPADGKIIQAVETVEERLLKKKVNKVSIFMSPFDPHLNRVPVSGRVEDVKYNKGRFLTAFNEKASFDNEQNAVLMRSENGDEILFVQIAGWLARRIVCYLKPGEAWRQGDVFGLIRFGSRMDVYFPTSYRVSVRIGEKVKAGESVLARAL